MTDTTSHEKRDASTNEKLTETVPETSADDAVDVEE